ncbi:1-acyl-sn-glycerol-3-phosphate acyltransferase 2-like [Olea europaea var. sylvestris]|uniref:1-acylglycerol-3-phosphate O-acyltransferase n=1 Tax=Olea europaea subsp. europaea TaxID=158383 RepID=A0A8S0VCM2_OLEEU|nr:1-acyl-sn-glycerol-3-phosphate acyltransferase 2-like [Olea europaea var. sylvestris]CAA3028269.1 1-acyl-sn-glycerol-3-phosphate acyltransferase 2 [Olea europaea subsp. europaea]
MAIAAVVVLPLGLLFLLSGLIVNSIQALLLVLVRPISKNTYRRINKEVTELLWLEVIWLFDWWANIKVELYTDLETFELMGKEHALLICNHKSDIDWLVGWVLAQRAGCLGSALAIIKKSALFLPVLGWSMWFSGFLFLERTWAKDENTLKSGFEGLSDYPRPFWLALFVEGTRFTMEKLLAAQEYAASAGFPVPRNVLIPRTKGFVAAVTHLRSFVPVIYNITLAIPKNEPRPTLLRLIRGRSSVVHLHIERHLMQELPVSDSDIAQWCKDIFVAKDALLEHHLAKDTFGNKQCINIGRPKKSLLVVLLWSCFLIFGCVKIFQWCTFSWGEIAFCAVFLALIMILMQILIVFSQSEHSTPPKISQPDPLKDVLLQK